MLGTFIFPLAIALLYNLHVISAQTCLDVGKRATAEWINARGQRCTWTGIVGSNFGRKTSNGGDYNCMGRCGVGCTGLSVGSVYTQACFSHDVCSYFNDASRAECDRNCGTAFVAASQDIFFGALSGCAAPAPHLPVSQPTEQPICDQENSHRAGPSNCVLIGSDTGNDGNLLIGSDNDTDGIDNIT